MLIKNWSWGSPTGKDPNFPYLATDTVQLGPNNQPVPNTGALGNNPEFNDAPGVPGQNDANPPGWFYYDYLDFSGSLTPDHAIDVYNGKIYDPSYGAGPFDNVGAWAANSLAGFAYVTYTDGKDAAGNPIRTYTLYGHMGVH